MKKLIISLLILSISIASGCGQSPKTQEQVQQEISTFTTFDKGMEILYEQKQALELSHIELTMLLTESENTEEVFAKFHEIEDATNNMIETLAKLEEITSGTNENTEDDQANYDQSTAYAEGVNTGYKEYNIFKEVGNTLSGNAWRDQDEAIRMGIYTGYKEIEKQFGEDAKTHLDPLLEKYGVEKIEDIFYADLDDVEQIYKESKDLPEGYGQNIRWHKEDIYEDLQEGTAEDVYEYLDNVATMIDDEIQEGQYGEYMPKHIADFAIRTIGYEEYVNYVGKRRETQVQLSNQVVEDEWEEPNLLDFFDEMNANNGDTSYFDDNYKKSDDEEFIIAYNKDTGQVIMSKIDTDNINEVNLPPGEYDILGTTDGNSPLSSEGIPVEEGHTTSIKNTTGNPMVDPGLLKLIASLGQPTFVLPTKADLKEKENQLALKKQLQEQLEYQLEILRSMEGGTFTYVSPDAKSKINAQLSEINKEVRSLEDELGKLEGLRDVIDTGEEAQDEFADKIEYPPYLNAVGWWSGDMGNGGSINLDFPSTGGSISGSFGACPSGVCWSSVASGSFDGNDGGSVSGSISGYIEETGYTSSYSISGYFSGQVYLNDGFASGTFSATTSTGTSNYTEEGTWQVTFDNSL